MPLVQTHFNCSQNEADQTSCSLWNMKGKISTNNSQQLMIWSECNSMIPPVKYVGFSHILLQSCSCSVFYVWFSFNLVPYHWHSLGGSCLWLAILVKTFDPTTKSLSDSSKLDLNLDVSLSFGSRLIPHATHIQTPDWSLNLVLAAQLKQ